MKSKTYLQHLHKSNGVSDAGILAIQAFYLLSYSNKLPIKKKMVTLSLWKLSRKLLS